MSDVIQDVNERLIEKDIWGAHGPKVDRVVIADLAQRQKLLTMDQVRERLSLTEPLTSELILAGSKHTKFRLNAGWNWEVDKILPSEPIDVFATIGEKEFQLTKDAFYTLTSNMGMTQAYVTKTPPRLIEPHLNFWYGYGIKDKDYKAIVANDQILAVTKSTVDPFSNLRILNETLDAIESKYGKGEVFADYKFEHSLKQTSLRLIVPETMRAIADTGEDNDNWSIGIQFLNSLIGASMTEISGYLFRYLCTNGAIDLNASENAAAWDRRKNGSEEDVYEWARASVDGVLGGLEHTLDKVQDMVYMEVGDGIVDLAKEIFRQNRVSPEAQNIVIENLANASDLNMYTVMQAITAAANDPKLDPQHALILMEAGGTIPYISHQRCGTCHHVQAIHN